MGRIFKERLRLIAAVMKRRNFDWLCGVGGRGRLAVAALAVATIAVSGCSATAKKASLEPATSQSSDQSADSAPPPGPEAKIQISYSQPNDYLDTLSLTKYSAADTVTAAAGSGGTAAVVRFDGGMPVWQIDIEPGMFSAMPIGFSSKNYAVSEVKYGKVPPHFVQSIPDLGPPEPLEPDHFYIFSVTRKSGSISYDAVKVNADGSLQAYEADPRAGTSFRLCCNVPSDFTITAPPSSVDSPSPDAAAPPDAGPPPDAQPSDAPGAPPSDAPPP
jgi:hypothetical protein